MMQRFFQIFFLVTLFISSCTILVFEDPVPPDAETVSEFPENFRGAYVYYIEDLAAKIVIGQNYFIRDSMAVYISDSLVVKPYKEGYVISERINDPTLKSYGKWYAYLLTPSKQGTLQAISFTTVEPENEKKILKKYQAEVLDKNEAQTLILIDGEKLNFSKLIKDKRATTITILHPDIE